jgi:hypothetical protein
MSMETSWLGVTNGQALRFFFERLKDVTEDEGAPAGELLYNASLLAHFATTSVMSDAPFPPSPVDLLAVFDLYVLDRSQHQDPDILEAGASQCLLLTGFFQSQQRGRHQVDWYASLGVGFYQRAAETGRDRRRADMMERMARHFGYWRWHQHRLAQELRDAPRLLRWSSSQN